MKRLNIYCRQILPSLPTPAELLMEIFKEIKSDLTLSRLSSENYHDSLRYSMYSLNNWSIPQVVKYFQTNKSTICVPDTCIIWASYNNFKMPIDNLDKYISYLFII